MIENFGSVCSGIEAASFILKPLGINPLWISEIDPTLCHFLSTRYPEIPNLGDMNNIPFLLKGREIDAPDLLCGGTPCQAFSLAGWKNGLEDHRGLLTLKFVEILDEIDKIRENQSKNPACFFWENVEGVLTDKTNAFGCFLAGLAGLDKPLIFPKKCNAGILRGKTRNIAWRVLDAKYFGLPQQRRRLYVLGGGKNFFPENILFELGEIIPDPFKKCNIDKSPTLFEEYNTVNQNDVLLKNIDGIEIEAFRNYTDCLYAAYGTKWNGNAAAFNGSLFLAQNKRLRRLTPIECERLMGFPDGYTDVQKMTLTSRFRAIGNSWAINVVAWIMDRLTHIESSSSIIDADPNIMLLNDFNKTIDGYINASAYPYNSRISNILDIVDTSPSEKLYLSDIACAGILRRKEVRKAMMNPRLEDFLKYNSQTNITRI